MVIHYGAKSRKDGHDASVLLLAPCTPGSALVKLTEPVLLSILGFHLNGRLNLVPKVSSV